MTSLWLKVLVNDVTVVNVSQRRQLSRISAAPAAFIPNRRNQNKDETQSPVDTYTCSGRNVSLYLFHSVGLTTYMKVCHIVIDLVHLYLVIQVGLSVVRELIINK